MLQLDGSQIAAMGAGDLTPEVLAADISRLKLLGAAERLKGEADALFADARTNDAIAKYGEALALVPVYVSCLSNRYRLLFCLCFFVASLYHCVPSLRLSLCLSLCLIVLLSHCLIVS